MEWETESSWISDFTDKLTPEFNSLLEFRNEDEIDEDASTVPVDAILPDDLLERIISHLPIASIFKVRCVCKRWNEIASSKMFTHNELRDVSSRKPWYIMLWANQPVGCGYDPVPGKWYDIRIPYLEDPFWSNASSGGLVCFMDNYVSRDLYIFNPITRSGKVIPEPPRPELCDYSALAINVNRCTRDYNVFVARSRALPGVDFQWEISIYLYDSITRAWTTSLTEVLSGWRGGCESVICDGVLYLLIFSTGHGGPNTQHGVIMHQHKHTTGAAESVLMESCIPVPWYLTCGRLLNLREKLVMVGGVGTRCRPDTIKGIGIWVLSGREWEEIARMPDEYFEGSADFDAEFCSRGADDFVYIQSYGDPEVFILDVTQRQWRRCEKCHVTKKSPLDLYNGFCFEPRLDIVP